MCIEVILGGCKERPQKEEEEKANNLDFSIGCRTANILLNLWIVIVQNGWWVDTWQFREINIRELKKKNATQNVWESSTKI